MSVDFTAASNRQVASGNVTTGAAYSYGAWIRPVTSGGNNGMIVAQGTASNLRMFRFSTATQLVFVAQRATTNGQWQMTTGFATLNRWRWVGVTYDAGSTANHPIMYILEQGVWSVLTNGAGLTRISTPAGAALGDGTPVRLGNQVSLTMQWDGWLAHLCVYARVLAEAEMRLVAERGARRLPRDLVLSWPGVRFNGTTLEDEMSQFDGTVSGTGTAIAAGEHPPARW